MLIISITIVVISIILLIAGYFDLKTGEIPDEVSFGLILIPLITSGVYSIYKGDYSFFIISVLLGGVYFILGYIPYHLGQWGGGDLKLLSGIGLTLGFLGEIGYLKDGILPYYLLYFVNMGLAAFPYAIAYALIFSFKKKQNVFSEFGNYVRKKNSILLFISSFIPSFLAFLLKFEILSWIYLLLPLFILSSFYLKAFERVMLIETVDIEKLQEGDIIAQDLIYMGEKIASKFHAEGLTLEQIRKIQKLSSEKKISDTITTRKISKGNFCAQSATKSLIRVKKGIKFAPVLFIAFLLTVFIGDVMGTIFNIIL